ncbi:MAG: NADH-quinone oxidoreductase subunit K [Verrucomicrobiota bacterium]
MELIIALTIGLLAAAGVYRLTGRTRIDVLAGLILLGQAANLTIFAAGGLQHNAAALLDKSQKGQAIDPTAFADPLPQALVLTAIVIGFGLIAFALTLLPRQPEE